MGGWTGWNGTDGWMDWSARWAALFFLFVDSIITVSLLLLYLIKGIQLSENHSICAIVYMLI